MNSVPLRMFPRITKTVRSLHSPLLQTKGLAPRFNIGLRTFSNSSHTSKGSGRPPLKDPDAQMLKDLDSLTGNGTTSKRFGTANRLREFDMDEKVVVITGGVGGLGMHMAEALLEAGAHVYAVDRLPFSKLPKEFHTLKSRGQQELNGRTFDYREMDVTDSQSVHSTIEEISNKHGRLDGLIAAAGINIEKSALEHTTQDFEKMFSINVTGCFLAAQAAAKVMIEKGTPGSIALIASMSGTIANKDLICPAYNASKAAVVQLTRNLAMEWGPHKIRVNSISPGYILTPMVHVLLEEHPHRATNWPKDNMLGRLSQPEEYRGAAVFLLSGASSFMTGTDLLIDGGHHAW